MNYPDGVTDSDINEAQGGCDMYEELVLDSIAERYYPEEIFSVDQLSAWAEANGYSKGDE